jgi:hypothetical protein
LPASPFSAELPLAELPAGGRADGRDVPDFPRPALLSDDVELGAAEPLGSGVRGVVVGAPGVVDVRGLGAVTVGAGASRSAWFGSVTPTALNGFSTTAGSETPAVAKPTGSSSATAAPAPRTGRHKRRLLGARPCGLASAAATIALRCRLALSSSIGRT